MPNIHNYQTTKRKLKRTTLLLESLSLFRLVLICVVLFLIVINCFVRPTYVNGSSMYPLLKDGEIGITNIIGIYIDDVERFDVVSVYDQHENKNLIKRVIGLPNETLEYKNGILYINGKKVKEDFLDKTYVKKQTNNGKIPYTTDYGPITLKDDEYFLCGDNRRISKDSRESGPFEKEQIIGKDFFILFH